MLLNLHVKNLAIIDETFVDFSDNLNILTGETGAGKSIIIGSINIALGAKVSADMIRKGADYALVELVFQIEEEGCLSFLRDNDLPVEDGQVIITRKIVNGRSINKVNGESVTVSTLRKIASYLIDIHGQNEHQSLLYKSKHLDIVDRFVREQAEPIKKEISVCYYEYCQLKKELEASEVSEEERVRELSFMEFEQKEIEDANLQAGEEEILTIECKKFSNAGAIAEGMDLIYSLTSSSQDAMSEQIGQAIRQIHAIVDYDEQMTGFLSQLTDLESMVNDLNRDISEYMSDFSYDEEQFLEVEERLNLVYRMKAKYGNTIEKIQEYYLTISDRINKLREYETYRQDLMKREGEVRKKLQKLSDKLSRIRRKGALQLQDRIRDALIDLNFLEVCFKIEFLPIQKFSNNGFDEIEFVISTNPGEDVKPLARVASGGELSRIMLAIKSVLADTDSIHTLVFDEIDVGISGRTAQKVSEELAVIANSHQVICITHLAQIAAMADAHYVIEKSTVDHITKTEIRPLSEEESTNELARILGGAKITDSVMVNAKEMKELASSHKKDMFIKNT